MKIGKLNAYEVDPFKNLLDKKKTLQAIDECIKNYDYEGSIEMLMIYFDTLYKFHFLDYKDK